MKEQDEQKNDLPQTTKDNRADHFKDISDFARSEIIFVRSAYKWLITIIGVLVIVGIYFISQSARDIRKEFREDVEQLKSEVPRRIDQEFKKENIHNMVEEKARNRIDEIADSLIEKQITNKISPRIKQFEEEVAILKKRNDFAQLGDKGIVDANRDSLEELENIKENDTNINIRKMAEAEIYRIYGFWGTMGTVGDKTLVRTGESDNNIGLASTKDLTNKKTDFKTHELIDTLLTNKNRKVRVLAARELGNRREKGVPQALVQCIEKDHDLEVIHNANEAFSQVTGFDPYNIFGRGSTKEWWQKHSGDVNQRLKDQK